MPLVLDASAVVPLALEDEDGAYAEAVLRRIDQEGVAYVAPIFFDELHNVLLVAERRGRCEARDSDAFLRRVREVLPLRIARPDQDEAMGLARVTGLSYYDATYLAAATADEAGHAIATLDERLREAARGVGVEVFEG